MSAAAPPIPAAEPAPSAVGRIVGALVSPGETFASIARRPTWLLPLLLLTAVSLAVTLLVQPKIDYQQMMRDIFEARGQTVSEDQLATIVEAQKRRGPVIGYLRGGVGPAVAFLVVAGAIWASFKAFGWDTTFRQAFGVTTHAFLPGLINGAILAFLVSRQETVNVLALEDIVRSNLGFLVERSSKVLHTLLVCVDAFSIWSFLLLVTGFSFAAKIRRGAAAGVIGGLWGVWVLVRIGLASIF